MFFFFAKGGSSPSSTGSPGFTGFTEGILPLSSTLLISLSMPELCTTHSTITQWCYFPLDMSIEFEIAECSFCVCFQEERWFSEELKKELDKVQGQLATNKVNSLKCLVVHTDGLRTVYTFNNV